MVKKHGFKFTSLATSAELTTTAEEAPVLIVYIGPYSSDHLENV
jgi:hypothetical protein